MSLGYDNKWLIQEFCTQPFWNGKFKKNGKLQTIFLGNKDKMNGLSIAQNIEQT